MSVVLNLRRGDVQLALTHERLKGRKQIARGKFSAVFEGSRKGRVLKLTADRFAYYLFCDGVASVTHRHFPKVRADYGMVGTTRVAGEEIRLYLYETEALQPLTRQHRQQVRLIEEKAGSLSRSSGRARHSDRAFVALGGLSKDHDFPLPLRNAFARLRNFVADFDDKDLSLDLHAGNFMARANGDLVLIDPFMDRRIFLASHGVSQY